MIGGGVHARVARRTVLSLQALRARPPATGLALECGRRWVWRLIVLGPQASNGKLQAKLGSDNVRAWSGEYTRLSLTSITRK